MTRLLLLCLTLAGCTHPQRAPITSGARTSVTEAATATGEAQRASERSIQHIRAFKNDAERIDFKAGRALRILDHP